MYVHALPGAILLKFLCDDINVIFWMLIMLDMSAGTAKLDYKPQKLIDAESAIVKRLAFKPAWDLFRANRSPAGEQNNAFRV